MQFTAMGFLVARIAGSPHVPRSISAFWAQRARYR